MGAHYTLIVGTKNWSSWSLRSWLALKAAAQAFEEMVIRLRVPEAAAQIAKYSPSGKVPLLRISEGGRDYDVFDSLAICATLAERHPEAKLMPDDTADRALVRSYSAEMHSGFPDLRGTLPMEFARRIPTPAVNDDCKAQVARVIASWEEALSRHPEGGFLFGRFSIADCMYGPVASRFTTYGIALPERSAAYAARMMALPAMREWGEASAKEVAEGLPLH